MKIFLTLFLLSTMACAQDREITRGDALTINWISPVNSTHLDEIKYYRVVWECDTFIKGESAELPVGSSIPNTPTFNKYIMNTNIVHGECEFRIKWENICNDIYFSEKYVVLIKLPPPAKGGFR